MHGGGGAGGDSFTNFGTGRAGPSGSSADGGPDPVPRRTEGVGSTAVLVVAVVLVLLFLAAVLLL